MDDRNRSTGDQVTLLGLAGSGTLATMAVRTITKLGDPILKSRSRPVERSRLATPEFRNLVRDMTETMIHAQGIGIAAPQVGVGLLVAIINAKGKPFAIINPRILKRSWRTEQSEEGCLSVPGVYGRVKRARTITVAYTDLDGVERTEEVSGLLARVFQHEIDHLNGTLFVDRVERALRDELSS